MRRGEGECWGKAEFCFPVEKLRLREREESAPGNTASEGWDRKAGFCHHVAFQGGHMDRGTLWF